jgi:hypothetical protein
MSSSIRRKALVQAAQALSACPRLYLDTEFESGRGPTRLCLLQISSGSDIFLIDTLKLRELEVLGCAPRRSVLRAGGFSEHVLPARVLRELKAKLQGNRPVRLSDALRGYRKRLLGSAIDEFCERQPPPLL